MSRDVTVQLFTGGFDSVPEPVDLPELKRKLSKIYQKTHITCAMIGWNPRADMTEVARMLKRHGTDVFLWLPAFSGWDHLAPLTDARGRPLAQDYRAEKGERFDFGCPANPDNVRRVIDMFERHYAGVEYDGVFLDKIRFPSFIGGRQSVLTCFCPYCRSRYHIADDFPLRVDSANPLGIVAYDGLRYSFEDESIARLFAYKAKAVTESVAALAAFLKGRGYKVGLDLFAPFLAGFVGQDYAMLAPHACFIKPMFYRMTTAPAGIPFELQMYASAFGGDPALVRRRKDHLLRILKTRAIDMNFLCRETAGIREKIGNTKIYAGIEINHNPKIAPVTAAYIQESMTALGDVDGFALSWDINSTPMENLDAALECI